ncbi:MAG: hypothetical protein SFV15_15660 [Polyangiaceae bacterium]|nr:hypothetical protein [Polyangiaceae bacterium]
MCWLSAAVSCAKNAEPSSDERAQLGRLSQAIDRLRAAPNLEKHPHLQALRQAPCGPELGCSLKQVCVNAYEMFGQSLGETRTVRRALNPADAGDASGASSANAPPASAEVLLQRLLKAEATLRESHTHLTQCEEAQGKLRLQYHL